MRRLLTESLRAVTLRSLLVCWLLLTLLVTLPDFLYRFAGPGMATQYLAVTLMHTWPALPLIALLMGIVIAWTGRHAHDVNALLGALLATATAMAVAVNWALYLAIVGHLLMSSSLHLEQLLLLLFCLLLVPVGVYMGALGDRIADAIGRVVQRWARQRLDAPGPR
jgi:hypothetical protein